MQTPPANHVKLALRLWGVVAAMFLFAIFLMPIFYNVICELTGLNGKTNTTSASTHGITPQLGRELRIQFLAHTGEGLPWRFHPKEKTMQVYPGEIKMTAFTVENLTDDKMISNAIPSVSPAQATPYFKKTQCFCFERQELPGGGKKDMPVIFYVDPSLPSHIGTITLSYTLYPVHDEPRLARNDI